RTLAGSSSTTCSTSRTCPSCSIARSCSRRFGSYCSDGAGDEPARACREPPEMTQSLGAETALLIAEQEQYEPRWVLARWLQRDRFVHAMALFGLAVLALVVYSNSFRAGFTMDSLDRVLDDPRLRKVSVENLKLIFTKDYWWPRGEAGLY